MREIKFRAWDKKENKMFQVFSITLNEDGTLRYVFYWDRYPMLKDKDVELMQWTGLQDTNGQDIYEGDIIQFRISTINGNLAPPHIFEVINKKGCFKAGHKHFSQFNCYDIIEVIGNKFENPELLK